MVEFEASHFFSCVQNCKNEAINKNLFSSPTRQYGAYKHFTQLFGHAIFYSKLHTYTYIVIWSWSSAPNNQQCYYLSRMLWILPNVWNIIGVILNPKLRLLCTINFFDNVDNWLIMLIIMCWWSCPLPNHIVYIEGKKYLH